MPKQSLSEQAAELAAKFHKLKEPVVIDRAQALDPNSKKPIYRFRVVSATAANGPSYAVTVDEHGEPVIRSRPAGVAVRAHGSNNR
jgi:hypothetical protein